MKNRAFTLLELLVVITIIGILSSIVIVSMSGSTDSATIAKGKAYAQQIHALLGHEAVLDLNFNENAYNTCSDGADVCDTSGYGNNGTIYNNEATFVSSPVDGHALDFNGSSDYIDCGENTIFNIATEITIEAWIKTDTVTPQYQGIVGKGDTSGERIYYLYLSNNKIKVLTDGTGGVDTLVTTETLSPEEWIHAVMVWSVLQDKLKVYLNGVEKSKDAMTTSLRVNANSVTVGRIETITYFDGLIDEVRIYSEALPSTEIQKHYVQGLEKLLADQVITRAEYDQRMKEFNQSLVLYEE
jgi:prepilin-type N-terminal cleavage/methylation domain-containing protein